MSTYLKWKVSYLSIFFKSDFNIFMFSVEIAIKCISIWLRLKNGKNVIHIPLVKCRFYISCLFYPILFMKPINKLVRTGTNEKPIATPSIWFKNATIKSKICFRDCFFLNCDSLHARLNSHHEAWSYKKKKHKKITAYRKSVQKEPTVKRCLLILDLKPPRSQVKGKHSQDREFQSLAVWGKKLLT